MGTEEDVHWHRCTLCGALCTFCDVDVFTGLSANDLQDYSQSGSSTKEHEQHYEDYAHIMVASGAIIWHCWGHKGHKGLSSAHRFSPNAAVCLLDTSDRNSVAVKHTKHTAVVSIPDFFRGVILIQWPHVTAVPSVNLQKHCKACHLNTYLRLPCRTCCKCSGESCI